MGRRTTMKKTISLLKTAKDRLCTLGNLDAAKELGLFIEKINPKIIDLEECKEPEHTLPPEIPDIAFL